MNVSVHIPGPLRSAVDGKRKVELGLPPAADLGDVVQALLALYPKLQRHLTHDRTSPEFQLRLLVDAQARLRLREGERIYLVAEHPRRLADEAEQSL